MTVSGNYELVSRADWEKVSDELSKGWMNSDIPERNWKITQKEREMVARGDFSLPVFATFLDLVQTAIKSGKLRDRSNAHMLLEVGAGSAWYGELLRLADVPCFYGACDYSPAFKEFAKVYAPLFPYTVADATNLPFFAKSRDIVVLGGCLLHIFDWRLVLQEAARVSSRWVLATRVPVSIKPTEMYKKVAYDVPCFEWLFSEKEFVDVAYQKKLVLKEYKFITGDQMSASGAHFSYLFKKMES